MELGLKNGRKDFLVFAITGWAALALLIFTVSPTSSVWNIYLFYALFCLAVFFSSTWVEFKVRSRYWVMTPSLLSKAAKRHGALLAMLLLIFLILQQQGLLSAWLTLGVLALAVAVEVVFNL